MDIKLCDDDDSVYEIDGVRVPRVTGVIAEMLHTPFEKELFKNMDVASLRGTIVHEYIAQHGDEFFLESDPVYCGLDAETYARDRARWTHDDNAEFISKDVGGRVAGWAQFARDEDFETIASEFRVVVPNSYGGTVDRRGRTKTWGSVTLEIKPDLTPFASLQLAAYVNAGANMMTVAPASRKVPDNPKAYMIHGECRDMINDRRLVVALNPKFKRGYKALCLDKVPARDSLTYLEDREVFFGALRLMNWKAKHGRLSHGDV